MLTSKLFIIRLCWKGSINRCFYDVCHAFGPRFGPTIYPDRIRAQSSIQVLRPQVESLTSLQVIKGAEDVAELKGDAMLQG